MKMSTDHLQNNGPDNDKAKWIDILQSITLTLFALMFIPIVTAALKYTAYFDPDLYRQEHVIFHSDSIFANIIMFFLLYAAFFLLSRRIRTERHEKVILLFLFLAGLLWVAVCGSTPGGDSAHVFNLASELNHHHYEILKVPENLYYFSIYPFQLGMVMFIQLITLFVDKGGYMIEQLFNVVLLTASFHCELSLMSLLFPDGHQRKTLSLLLLISSQAVLMCTFCYGIIPSYSFTIMAICRFVRWSKDQSAKNLILSLLFLTLAVILKQNAMIVMIAVCVILFCMSVRQKKIRLLLYIVPFIILPVFSNRLVISYYERTCDVELGEGLNMSNWFVLGASEGPMYFGWDNAYVPQLRKQTGDNIPLMNEISEGRAKEVINGMKKDPVSALRKYHWKNTSQWAETTYQSIWISRVKQHLNLLGSGYRIVYDHEGTICRIMDHTAQFVYVFFLIGLLILVKRNYDHRMPEETVLAMDLFALIIMGGLIYHTFFEAKSQYILIYYLYMLPVAALGITCLTGLIRQYLPGK
ncbi:MAG: hypothetical protein K6F23_09055 [Solobacterium sp.]|nr:hypothetical protein [Solobacterium sp.]